MAESPTHRLGQIIGDVLERALQPHLQAVAAKNKLYLDSKGPRAARGKNLKVSWKDSLGNVHDLDYVLERNGSLDKTGMPVAFIESAWRRYTKHSRNKAQEIQGAVSSLATTYSQVAPFLGVVLAGEFTDNALKQLRSLGFEVLYFPRADIVSAFKKAGIDADWDEDTPDDHVRAQVDKWENQLSEDDRARIVQTLVEESNEDVKVFFSALERAITRQIERIIVLPLHGKEAAVTSVNEAITFVEQYAEDEVGSPLIRYEVEIRYETGDTVKATFHTKEDTLDFLRSFEPPVLTISEESEAELSEDSIEDVEQNGAVPG